MYCSAPAETDRHLDWSLFPPEQLAYHLELLRQCFKQRMIDTAIR